MARPASAVGLRAVAALALLLSAGCSRVVLPSNSSSASSVVTPTESPTSTASPTGIVSASPVVTPTASPDHGTVVMAAGDIACDPSDPNFNAGKGTSSRCRQEDTAKLLSIADLILPLGDNQYECGGMAAYQSSFDRSWGVFKARMRPTLGNHEHLVAEGPTRIGTGCHATQLPAGFFSYFGSTAPAGAYSFDVGGWHFATVDSTCDPSGCLAQAKWLRGDLAAHPTLCSLVYYHHPRWSSGEQGNHPQADPFWRVAMAAGVEVILNGHDHDYERFAPMDANGLASSAGMREFVVGTGGRDHTPIDLIQPNSEVRNADTFGVLRLTLHAASYTWQFLPIAGQSFTDRGSGSCH